MAVNESMKWPTDKARYDLNYLRIYGERCDVCDGRGYHEDKPPMMKQKVRTTCLICQGIGYVEKIITNTKRKGHDVGLD